MDATATGKPIVLSVHNLLSEENIPIENFLRVDEQRFALHALSLLQSDADARKFIARAYPESCPVIYGLDWHRRPMRSFWRMANLMRRLEPEVVHLNHGLSGFLAGLLARCLTRARVVSTLHNDFRTFRLRHKILLMAAMCFSHLIVCNSRSTLGSLGRWKQTLLRWKCFRICYNGVNRDKLLAALTEPSTTTGDCQTKPFCVGFVGRLVPQKDIPTLLKGFAKFHAKRQDSQLLVAGDGPLSAELKRLAQMLQLGDAVKFKGFLSRNDVYQMFAQVDVAVISSRWEGFCNAMVEAMFAEKAIVATDIEVLTEVLSRDCGLFFDVGNDDQLAERLLSLHDDESLRKRLGSAAVQRADSKFSIDACAESYSKCYREIIDDSPARKKAA